VISLEMIRLTTWQGRDLDKLFVDQTHVDHYQPQLFGKKRKSGQSKHILVIGSKFLVAENLNSRFRNLNWSVTKYLLRQAQDFGLTDYRALLSE
jgi:hypothetical protein